MSLQESDCYIPDVASMRSFFKDEPVAFSRIEKLSIDVNRTAELLDKLGLSRRQLLLVQEYSQHYATEAIENVCESVSK